MMYVGVDVHRKVCRAAIVNDGGELVDEFSFINSKKGVEDFTMRLSGVRSWLLWSLRLTFGLGFTIFSRGMG